MFLRWADAGVDAALSIINTVPGAFPELLPITAPTIGGGTAYKGELATVQFATAAISVVGG